MAFHCSIFPFLLLSFLSIPAQSFSLNTSDYMYTHDCHDLTAGRTLLQTRPGVPGMDVSSHQGNVNWRTAYNNGARFAYIKATEGTGYTNPYFSQQYVGSYRAGFIRGAYHFGRPDISNGATQATYFLKNGGRWSSDGRTLPGALDIEYNPSCGSSCTPAQKCYNLRKPELGKWIQDFVNTYRKGTGVYPVIYSTADWYNTCVGTYGDFSSVCPFWLACYCPRVITYPYNWKVYTFWQYADSGTFPGDQNVFNGPYSQLQKLAKG
ncbi:N,O-diacetylmuramidase [Selaginella moellendorffii]|nr:N,O-diacetylmuramidase [Selaginella moellendorffii]|eukprot:XP_002972808.2 N,O-diacetylmuramidase [Selaginella moellendorffii]